MDSFDFVLTPGYCFFNGVGILNQHGSEINFLIENQENHLLKERLERAFINHLEFVKRQKNCPESYKGDIKVIFTPGTKSELNKIISGLYKYNEKSEEEYRLIPDFTGIEKSNSNVERSDENAAAIVLLDTLFRDAQQKGVTDIHIENETVKFREQGKLKFQIRLQQDKSNELIQRIKLLAGMNLVENRRCQDGHFVSEINGKGVFVRASTVPVIGKDYREGKESVVLRLLDVNRIPINLADLGFDERQLLKIDELLHYQNGLILICGPTGSGKSTTVAAMLNELVKSSGSGMKIISLEDPPEYLITGVTQMKIDAHHGTNFEEALNHIFRQDPDVLMIGEIRDKESALAAIQGSLTGHLVFATVHSSSAALSMLRLENLGIDRKLLSSVLRGVIVQELGYVGNEPILMADVSIPESKFDSKVSTALSETDLDQLFSHCVNSSATVRKTIEIMKKKSLLEADKQEEIVLKESQKNQKNPKELKLDSEKVAKKNHLKRSVLPVIGSKERRKISGGNDFVE